MKGTPDRPSCSYSKFAVELLKYYSSIYKYIISNFIIGLKNFKAIDVV